MTLKDKFKISKRIDLLKNIFIIYENKMSQISSSWFYPHAYVPMHPHAARTQTHINVFVYVCVCALVRVHEFAREYTHAHTVAHTCASAHRFDHRSRENDVKRCLFVVSTLKPECRYSISYEHFKSHLETA